MQHVTNTVAVVRKQWWGEKIRVHGTENGKHANQVNIDTNQQIHAPGKPAHPLYDDI